MKKLDLPIVLAGDYNIIPTDRDCYNPERWRCDALFCDEVKASFARLGRAEWPDALRQLHPDDEIYTFWDHLRNAWRRNAGLRLDHLLLSPLLTARLLAASVDRHQALTKCALSLLAMGTSVS